MNELVGWIIITGVFVLVLVAPPYDPDSCSGSGSTRSGRDPVAPVRPSTGLCGVGQSLPSGRGLGEFRTLNEAGGPPNATLIWAAIMVDRY